MLTFHGIEAITFDCYGTLIDWESGILEALGHFRREHDLDVGDDQLLELYARSETLAECRPYRKYREVLRDVMRAIAKSCGVDRGVDENLLVDSLPSWRPFGDTVDALSALKRHFKLGIISNVDDDLVECTIEHLGQAFDWVTTAEQAGAYKPAQRTFRHALHAMGVPRSRVVHAAQSKFHDIAPASSMDWSTVWVNRRHGRDSTGATHGFDAEPDLEVPDLATLVRVVERDRPVPTE